MKKDTSLSNGPTPSMTVGVVLLNWNSGDCTIACIQSLLEGDRRPERIVVYDNASTDGSPDMIEARFPSVELVRNQTNEGFAAPCNAGIRRFLLEGIDVIWLLNNDTVVDKKCLGALLAEFVEHPDLEVVTGKILFAKPGNRIWYAGATWKNWSFEPVHRGVLEIDVGLFDQPKDVPFVSGCCMAARRGVFGKVGLLDERYFAYSEDAEWCRRAANIGVRMRYQPKAFLWHAVSASIRKNTLAGNAGTLSPFFIYLSVRNRLFLIRQHAKRPWQMSMAVLILCCRCLWVLVRVILLGRWAKAHSLWNGIRDGIVTDISPKEQPADSLHAGSM